MKCLKKAVTFSDGTDDGWKINWGQLRNIRDEIDTYSEVFISEEDIEAVCLALIKLGYMKFDGD